MEPHRLDGDDASMAHTKCHPKGCRNSVQTAEHAIGLVSGRPILIDENDAFPFAKYV